MYCKMTEKPLFIASHTIMCNPCTILETVVMLKLGIAAECQVKLIFLYKSLRQLYIFILIMNNSSLCGISVAHVLIYKTSETNLKCVLKNANTKELGVLRMLLSGLRLGDH